jgi:hypothetical protein
MQSVMFTTRCNFDNDNAAKDMRMQLQELQCDLILEEKFSEDGVLTFFISLPEHRLPRIIQFSCQIYATYDCIYSFEQLIHE